MRNDWKNWTPAYVQQKIEELEALDIANITNPMLKKQARHDDELE